jgi:hypothetical protein
MFDGHVRGSPIISARRFSSASSLASTRVPPLPQPLQRTRRDTAENTGSRGALPRFVAIDARSGRTSSALRSGRNERVRVPATAATCSAGAPSAASHSVYVGVTSTHAPARLDLITVFSRRGQDPRGQALIISRSKQRTSTPTPKCIKPRCPSRNAPKIGVLAVIPSQSV